VAYSIRFTDDADEHLEHLKAHDRATVLDDVSRQLAHEPAVETRNRKRMDPEKRMYIAPWELRIGKLRVYYAVEAEPEPTVVIAAVGIKVGNRVWIGGEEVRP
jgi:mRNA-degrading endonuclease RelE of RelBE toxin-antitoxin system